MKPILFNTEMVKAILDGRKKVTRRLVKPQPSEHQIHRLGYCIDGDKRDIGKFCFGSHEYGGHVLCVKPPYQSGDVLYVRETWCDWPDDCGHNYFYKATDDGIGGFSPKWRPSIHMSREAARIFLRVTDVRVERLQDITEEEAEKEGAKAYGSNNCSGTSARIAFAEIWDGATKPEYEWRNDPWVWVIEFERISKEEAYAGNIKED